jgi:hypothetical protein
MRILCFLRAVSTAESISLQDLMCIEYGRPFWNLCLQPGHKLSFPIINDENWGGSLPRQFELER